MNIIDTHNIINLLIINNLILY